MEVIVAAHAGFCSGVKQAVKAARAAVDGSQRPVYCLGPLVHNPQLVQQLETQGIRTIHQLHEAEPGSCLVIRSHGVGPQVLAEAEAHQLQVIDATCPHVSRAQQLALQMSNEGYQVVIVGDPGHPEVDGVVGWSGGQALVVPDAIAAQQLPHFSKVAVIAQTTQPEANVRQIIEVLEQRGELVELKTICGATRRRQQAVSKLARQVDLMLVLGGRNSANTNKLARLSQAEGIPTYHLEVASELQRQWFEGANKVGVTAGASTPDWIIEEVVERMAEWDQVEVKEQEEQELEVQQEQAEEPADAVEQESSDQESSDEVEAQLAGDLQELKRGVIIPGTIVKINDNEVLVDIGAKSEGIIPLQELSYRPVDNPADVVQMGETIEVYVIKVENEEGHPILSKKRADRQQSWAHLEEALDQNHELQAEVIEVVKGGLLVDVGVRGFVPASLVERGYVENLESYLGNFLRLRVIELDRSKNKVVLSQKAILDEEYKSRRQVTWETLTKGQVKSGIVRRLTNFGAFVDIGGVDGLLHVSEISWGRVEHPGDVLKEGQEIEVLVLGIDPDEGKVSLGLKQLTPNPWDTAADRYPVGSNIEGKVMRIAPFGAFVEVEPGIEGLVHISQLADQHVAKTEDVVSVNEVITVKILSVDQDAQRMSLSLREARDGGGGGGGDGFGRPRERRQVSIESSSSSSSSSSGGNNDGNVTLGDLFGDLFENNDRDRE